MGELAQTVITAVTAVTGTLVGGLTSFATTYFVQRRLRYSQDVHRDVERREDLYAQFQERAAQLMLDALDHELEDPAKLIGIETLAGRIRVTSSASVLAAAEAVLHHILASYERPPVDPRKTVVTSPRAIIEPLVVFTTACREERLEMLRGT